jgi:hypothetical protein
LLPLPFFSFGFFLLAKVKLLASSEIGSMPGRVSYLAAKGQNALLTFSLSMPLPNAFLCVMTATMTVRGERIFWCTAEAAAYIGVSEDTLWTWASPRGKRNRRSKKFKPPKPPVVRFGKLLRFPIEEFKTWAKNPESIGV